MTILNIQSLISGKKGNIIEQKLEGINSNGCNTKVGRREIGIKS